MSAQPEPRPSEVPGGLHPSPIRAEPDRPVIVAKPATILPWRARPAPDPATIGMRPYQAPGDRLGSARGLLLGLAIGALLWTAIIAMVWRLLR